MGAVSIETSRAWSTGCCIAAAAALLLLPPLLLTFCFHRLSYVPHASVFVSACLLLSTEPSLIHVHDIHKRLSSAHFQPATL